MTDDSDHVLVYVDEGCTRAVHVVEDQGQHHALKWAQSHDEVKWLEREAQAYERIGHHPGLIGYFGTTVDSDGLIVLKLEHAQYGSIPQFWRKYELSPVHLRIRWLLQVAKGIAHMHSKGVIHGNLTPGNILIMANLDAKLCDLAGCSINGSSLRTWGLPPFYPLPTRRDLHYLPYFGVKDDIFAFGTVILSVITARYPYLDVSLEQKKKLFADRDHLVLPPVPETVDPRLAKIITGCWKGDYKRADKLVAAFEHLAAELNEKPLLGHRPTDDLLTPVPSNDHYVMDARLLSPEEATLVSRSFTS
jgi:serine/threonine protein kinase